MGDNTATMMRRHGVDRMDIAIVADIHGNRWALEAVLEDIERRRAALIVDLGDSLLGPLDPAGTADLLMSRSIPSILGNQDRAILDDDGEKDSPSLRLAGNVLNDSHRSWLAALPPTRLLLDEILLCHGTPSSDSTYLLEQPTSHGSVLRPAAEIVEQLAGTRQDLVICAHSHIPRLVALTGGRLVANPGSVGVQAYTDDLPVPHKMETGSPHARYAALSNGHRGWCISFRAVPYDWERAARSAQEIGVPAYAAWIRTGRA